MQIKIVDNSKPFLDEKDEAIERALEIIGGYMERYAKQNCPVDTGLLRNSITYCIDGEHPHQKFYQAATGGKAGAYDGKMPEEGDKKRSVSVGTNVEYAPIVEYSDRAKHTSGRAHFLRDSLANHINEYNQIFTSELKKVK